MTGDLARAPDDVLIQQWAEPAQGDPFGRRLRADGTIEECSGATAEFVDGEWSFGTQTLAWRRVAQLGDDAVATLLDTARRLLTLPERRPGTRILKAEQTWTLVLEGRREELTVTGDEPEVTELDRALQLAAARSAEA